jgi:hypothetical protein
MNQQQNLFVKRGTGTVDSASYSRRNAEEEEVQFFDSVFDIPPRPFRKFRTVSAEESKMEEEFNSFVVEVGRRLSSNVTTDDAYYTRREIQLPLSNSAQAQRSAQQLHENDFEPLPRTISGTPGAGFVSDVPNDDEFCNFIRMNIDDPFDDSRKTPSRLTERRSTAFCQEVDRCVVWGGSRSCGRISSCP